MHLKNAIDYVLNLSHLMDNQSVLLINLFPFSFLRDETIYREREGEGKGEMGGDKQHVIKEVIKI